MQPRQAAYIIESAKIQNETGPELVISPFSPPWLIMLIRSGIFILIGSFIIALGGKSTFLFGFILLSIAAVFPATLPITSKIVFNFLAGQITFTADYLLRRPRHIELQVPFSQIARLDFRSAKGRNRRIVDVNMLDGTKISLDFGVRTREAEKLVNKFSPLAGSAAAPILNSPVAVQVADVAGTQALMQREIRSWSIWLFIMGAGQMLAVQGFSSWGALLIGVGLASFYFREPAMFVVYAATIAWAGISNLLSGAVTAWSFFALFQFFLAYVVFKQFRRFQKAEQEVRSTSEGGPETLSRATRLFPWLSALFGVGAAVGYGLMWIGVFICIVLGISSAKSPIIWQILAGLETITIYIGILAVAMGLAGWIASFPRKWASILGTITGGLTLIVSLVVSLVLNL